MPKGALFPLQLTIAKNHEFFFIFLIRKLIRSNSAAIYKNWQFSVRSVGPGSEYAEYGTFVEFTKC